MKVNEIPLRIFYSVVVNVNATSKGQLPADHLGGRRMFANIGRSGELCAIFTEHSELNCCSLHLFPSHSLAEKGISPICCVQVGPRTIGWNEEQGACCQELKASFSLPNSPPPGSSAERWVNKIWTLFATMERIAEPVQFTDLAMDLVE